MPTITGTLKKGDGSALSATLRFWMPTGPTINSAGSVISPGVVTTETNSSTGAFSVTLEPGNWVVTWPNGGQMGRLNLAVPLAPGTYDLEDLVTGSPIISSPQLKWYEDVAEMLASDSRLYATANLRNGYDGDGIISGWTRILKASAEATGLSDNGDSILESTDGYSFWVRTWISS